MIEIIAHRGSSLIAPENTLAAVVLAWHEQADAVEVDVRQTSDGLIVAIHDATTVRTAGVALDVETSTYSALSALEVGTWKDPRFKGERIPTLKSLLETIPPGKQFFVEIKSGACSAPAVVEVIHAAQRQPHQIIAISFSLPVLQAVKDLAAEIPCYLIVDCNRDGDKSRWEVDLDATLADAPWLAGLDVAGDGPLTQDLVDRLHAAGRMLYVWTVDEPRDAAALAAIGVDGITTNRPGWLRAQVELLNSQPDH